MEDLIKRVYIPAATSETAQCFARFHPQKPAHFPSGQSERFHPANPSFYPPAVTAGITHYTLQAKPCAKGASPLETQFCRNVYPHFLQNAK